MPAEGKSRSAATRHWPIALGGLAVVIVGSVAFASLHHAGSNNADPLSSSTGTTGPTSGSTGTVLFVSASPADAATNVDYAAPITLKFSAPLATDTPLPTLSPPVPGTWTVSGSSLSFVPTGSYTPSAKETLTIPATLHAKDGGTLGTAMTSTFTVQVGSITRLQQLLAELNYLPVNFAPAGEGPATTRAAAALDDEPTDPALISLDPAAGAFSWRFATIPPQLAANWDPGEWNVVTQGAVMAFESDHNLALDGEPGPLVWKALTNAVANRASSARPYDYLIVTETLPESLYVWRDGAVAFQTPINTGVSGAATPLGTWPVYLRFTSTTMRGTNPDGTKYADPGVPWVSYFHGSDAVHGFWRSGYGYPQSDGCVEVPIDAAATVYPYDPYGTLVTVTTGDLASEFGVAGPVMSTQPAPPASVSATPPTTAAPRTTTTTAPPHHGTTPARHGTTTTTTAPTTTTVPPTTTLPPTTTQPTTTVPPTSVPPTTAGTTTTTAPTTTT